MPGPLHAPDQGDQREPGGPLLFQLIGGVSRTVSGSQHRIHNENIRGGKIRRSFEVVVFRKKSLLVAGQSNMPDTGLGEHLKQRLRHAETRTQNGNDCDGITQKVPLAGCQRALHLARRNGKPPGGLESDQGRKLVKRPSEQFGRSSRIPQDRDSGFHQRVINDCDSFNGLVRHPVEIISEAGTKSRRVDGSPRLWHLAVMKAILALLMTAAAALAQDESQLMKDAMTALEAGDLNGAKALFEAVVYAHPSNAQARRQLALVTQKLVKTQALQSRLHAIVLPKVELNDASVREAFTYMVQLINRSATGGFQLNTVWLVPEDYQQNVTLRLDAIPSNDALRLVADAAGLDITFDEHAVRVSAPTKAGTP